MECLDDGLTRAQIALDEAKAREQEAIVDCQRVLKVFKRGTKMGNEVCHRGTLLKLNPSSEVKVRILSSVVLLLLWWERPL